MEVSCHMNIFAQIALILWNRIELKIELNWIVDIWTAHVNLELRIVAIKDWCSSRWLQLNAKKTERIGFCSRSNLKKLIQAKNSLQLSSTSIEPAALTNKSINWTSMCTSARWQWYAFFIFVIFANYDLFWRHRQCSKSRACTHTCTCTYTHTHTLQLDAERWSTCQHIDFITESSACCCKQLYVWYQILVMMPFMMPAMKLIGYQSPTTSNTNCLMIHDAHSSKQQEPSYQYTHSDIVNSFIRTSLGVSKYLACGLSLRKGLFPSPILRSGASF